MKSCHTARPAIRVDGDMIVELRRPRKMPVATVATMPLTPIASAVRYTTYGVRSEIVISIGASSIGVRMRAMT